MSHWELAEYISCGLVTTACFGEFIADFTDWFTGGAKEKKERLAKLSTLLLIASLALELICLVRTNQISGKLIGSLAEKAEEAKANLGKQEERATKAESELAELQKAAADAKSTQQKVEINLETQRRRAADAEKELLALRMQHLPRSLHFGSQQDIDATIDLLRHNPSAAEILYKDGDAEAYWLADEIFAILRMAEWKVSKPMTVPREIEPNVVEELGAQTLGVTITAKAILSSPKKDDPYSLLRGALVRWLGQVYGGRNPSLPDNFVRIVVMPKP
jgi:hypothetical protein